MSNALEQLRDRVPALAWEPLTWSKLPSLAHLVRAIEHVDDSIERHDLAYFENLWHGSGGLPAAVLGHDRHGNVVAWAWVVTRPDDVSPRTVTMLGGVHPAWRDQSVGTGLVRWQLDAARAWDAATRRPYYGPLKMTVTIEAKLDAARKMFVKQGFEPERWFLDMFRPLDPNEPLVVPPLPAGVTLLPYLEVDGDAVRVAHNEVWKGFTGRETGPAEWDSSIKRGAGCRALSWVAAVGRRIVGYAINSSAPLGDGQTAGWTERLGVIPAWRRQGIATVLLQQSARTFLQQGYAGAGIGFDTIDPERGDLYTRLGYETVDAMVAHTRTEAPEGAVPAPPDARPDVMGPVPAEAVLARVLADGADT